MPKHTTLPAGASDEQSRKAASQKSHSRQGRRSVMHRRPWWRAPVPLLGSVIVGVTILVVIFIIVSNQNNTSADSLIGKPVSAALVQAVTRVDPSVISAVGTGGLQVPLQAISDRNLSMNGKPEVLYVGGEFCPVCAAERWSLINALSRFGTFSNLRYMRSAVDDGDVATFTFHGASYRSKYISFVPIEAVDRSHNTLDPLTSEQQQLWTNYAQDRVPFIDLAERFWGSGGFEYTVLSGKDQAQIASALKSSSNPITQAIIGNANYLTAAVCKLTFNQPASACGNATIRTIAQHLDQKQ